jgi:hypothetical protein
MEDAHATLGGFDLSVARHASLKGVIEPCRRSPLRFGRKLGRVVLHRLGFFGEQIIDVHLRASAQLCETV